MAYINKPYIVATDQGPIQEFTDSDEAFNFARILSEKHPNLKFHIMLDGAILDTVVFVPKEVYAAAADILATAPAHLKPLIERYVLETLPNNPEQAEIH